MVAVVVVFRRSSESSTVEAHPLVITCGSLPSTTDSGTGHRMPRSLYAVCLVDGRSAGQEAIGEEAIVQC